MDANARCVQCGEPHRTGQRFCSGCGFQLGATRELKQVSVLLADLCDSTAQVVASGTEDGQAFLESAYRLMSEAVAQFGGAQIQWRGDELLALFGVPTAQEDHAVNACLSALRIIQRMTDTALGTAPMAVRIGIASGEVLIGPGAPGLGARYSADGAAIHLAARLERLAAPGTTLISASTRRLVEHRIDTVAAGKRSVRGFDKPVQVFRLVAESTPSPLGRRRHLAPLLGRESIVAALESAVHATMRGGLKIFGLRGDAGVGKSRLLEEMCRKLEASSTAFVIAGSRQVASEVPYGVASDLLRALLALAPSPHINEPALAELLDLGDPGDAWRALSPALRRRRIVDVIVGVIADVTRLGPLVMLVDDVFLSDPDSLRLLESLVRPLASHPLMLLLTYRTEFVHRWGETPAFTERVLSPLTPDGMAGLASALLGSDSRLDELRHALLERADGNPFFLEQMVLMMVDQGSLVGRAGDYRVTTEPDKIDVPPSVVATISSQVDRLSPEAKRALEAGAVLGEPLDPHLIAEMLQADADALALQLRSAVSAGLLADRAHAGAEALAFRHALVRETIYNALTRQRRADLHRAAYGSIRARSGEHVADVAHALARHAYLGGDWVGAAECSLAAMKRSTSRSANRDALLGFERGLDAASRIPNSREQVSSELALRMAALGPMMAMGQLEGIVTNLERAETISAALGDARQHAAVSLQLAVSLWTRGSYRQGLEVAHNANQAAQRAESRSLQMAALQARMMLHHGLGRNAEAADDALQVERGYAAELAARRLLPGWAVVAVINLRAFQADLLAGEGRLTEAQTMLDRAYSELAAQDHAFSRILTDFVQGGVMMMTGRARAAATLLQSAHDLCRTQDVATMLPPILARLAGALAEDGRASQALQLLEPAIEKNLHLMGGRYNDFYFPYYHASALWAASRLDEAAAVAESALGTAMSLEQESHAARARLLAGRIRWAAGHTSEALAHFEAASVLAAQCQMPWLVGQVTLAELERAAHAP